MRLDFPEIQTTVTKCNSWLVIISQSLNHSAIYHGTELK